MAMGVCWTRIKCATSRGILSCALTRAAWRASPHVTNSCHRRRLCTWTISKPPCSSSDAPGMKGERRERGERTVRIPKLQNVTGHLQVAHQIGLNRGIAVCRRATNVGDAVQGIDLVKDDGLHLHQGATLPLLTPAYGG